MESNELYELYYKIALDVAKKQKGTKGAVCVDITFETALEFAKQYKELCEGKPADLKNANCAIFDVSEMLPDLETVKLAIEKYRKKKTIDGWYTGIDGVGYHFRDGIKWALNYLNSKGNLR